MHSEPKAAVSGYSFLQFRTDWLFRKKHRWGNQHCHRFIRIFCLLSHLKIYFWREWLSLKLWEQVLWCKAACKILLYGGRGKCSSNCPIQHSGVGYLNVFIQRKNPIDLWSVSLKGLWAQRMGAGLGIKSCSISLVLFCNYWTDLFRWSWNSKIMLLRYRQVEHESLFSFWFVIQCVKLPYLLKQSYFMNVVLNCS